MSTIDRLLNIVRLLVLPRKRYVVIGLQPFSFWWLEALPYTVFRTVCYENGEFCDEFEGHPRHIMRVVDLHTGYLTNIVEYDNGHLALTFTERRGADGHPHPNGGAYWIGLDWSALK